MNNDIFLSLEPFEHEINASPQMLKDLVAASEAVSYIGTRKDDKSDELRRRVARVEEEHLYVSPGINTSSFSSNQRKSVVAVHSEYT